MVLLKGLGERMAEDERRRVLVEGDRSNTSQQMNGMTNSNGSGYAEVNGTSNPPAAAITAAPSSGGYLSGLGSWASSKMTSSAMPAENAHANTPATPNSAEITISKPTPPSTKKATPAFSSLSLSDANIGGNASGWSDDEIDDDLGGNTDQKNTASTSSVIPSWAAKNEDDEFLAQFEKKPIMRPRANISSGRKLKTNPSAIAAKRRAEMAKRKAVKSSEPEKSAMKLSTGNTGDLNDGWDDF